MTGQTILSTIIAALAAAGTSGVASGHIGLEVSAVATSAGSSVEVTAHVAPPATRCLIQVSRDGRPYRSRELRPKRAANGVVRWRWSVPRPGGTFSIRVRCGRAGSAETAVTVLSAQDVL